MGHARPTTPTSRAPPAKGYAADDERRSESHPTMKPAELVSSALANSSRPADLVYEL